LLEKKKTDKNQLWNFWKRRWFRTLPNYFLLLIILCLLHFIFSEGFSFRSIARYFIFSQNLLTEHPLWFFSEAWSLSIEEWFYLITPLLLFIAANAFKLKPWIAVLITAAFIIAFVTIFRLVRFEQLQIQTIDEWDLIFRKEVISRLDGLMFGVIGAWLAFYQPIRWVKYRNPLLITGILLFLFIKFISGEIFSDTGMYNCVFSFTLVSIATLFLLPFLSHIKTGKGFLFITITRISLISYSMYLVNLSLVKNWIIDNIDWTGIFNNGYLLVFCKYSLFWLLTIFLSVVLYKYFELPVMNLRDKKKQSPA
jgi:peptidoglycan/LPS O-acetylase OafA/YrhL